MTTYQEVMDYLERLERFGMDLGLKRIEAVLRKLGNPERKIKTIHVAGTNGKGSVSSMLSSVLKESGYRVGLYISPPLVDFRERMSINGEFISKEDVVKYFRKVISKGVWLTHFEFVTAMAFLYFREKKTDFVVLEVGLGGRLDSTNVVRPVLSVITNVDYEHTQILGETIEEIAREKSGIIKQGIPVVTNTGKGLDVIKKIASGKNSELTMVKGKTRKISSDLEKQTVKYRDLEINLPLLGDFQIENLETVLEVVDTLKKRKIEIPKEKIKSGLEKTRWPGRLEIIQKDPLLILDCAHNPSGIKALKRFIKTLDYREIILVIGFSKDKDYRKMFGELKPLADKIILTRAGIDRALEPEVIKESIKNNVVIKRGVRKALEYAKSLASKEDLILVTGSIYLVGDVKRVLLAVKSL